MKIFPIFLLIIFGLLVPSWSEDLYTRSYVIPGFIEEARSAEPSDPATGLTPLEEAIKARGFDFIEGTSATSSDGRTLVLRATLRDHRVIEGYFREQMTRGAQQIHLYHETIEVEKTAMSQWLMGHRMTGSAGELRATLQEWIRDNRARVHHFTALTTTYGQRSKTESVELYYYPTEYDQPSMPSKVTLDGDDARVPLVGVQGASLDRRSVGTTLEVDPVIGADGVTIDLNLAPEFVHLAGETVWPHPEADALRRMEFPMFHAGKITTQITMKDGGYFLLGTTVPEVSSEGFEASVLVHFVRGDIGYPAGRFTLEKVSEFEPSIPEMKEFVDENGMIDRAFFTPPGFIYSIARTGTAMPADPFAEPEEEPIGVVQNRTAKSALEKVGIEFPEGASAVYLPGDSRLYVRNLPAQIEKVEQYIDSIRWNTERQILIVTEFIEASNSQVTEWLAGPPKNSDGNVLRTKLESWIDEGSARLLHLTSVVARSGQRAKVESVHEYIYPTEMSPGDVPNEITLSDGAVGPMIGPTPTAFEVRNLGLTLEVDPVLGADGYTIDLNLAPESVEVVGLDLFPSAESDPAIQTALPRFHEMKGTSQVTMTDGNYELLSLSRPYESSDGFEDDTVVLIFLRADISRVEAE